MSFGSIINKYRNEILSDLDALISIRSVSAEGDKECQRALDFILKRAEDFGLTSLSIESKAGEVSLGAGGRQCGVVTHLDVVPAGGGWHFEPFRLTRKNGRLYGRGVADDKGAAIVVLYCLKALKDEEIEGKNTLRAVFGTDEETGMSDISAYFASRPPFDMSFTPDSEYGVCRCEKGILQLRLTVKRGEGCALLSVVAGSAVNAVPDRAEAELECNEEDYRRLVRLCDRSAFDIEAVRTEKGAELTAYGKAAHACEAWLGKNALTGLCSVIYEAFGEKSAAAAFILGRLIGGDVYGSGLGISCEDKASGKLSVNAGTAVTDGGKISFTLDIRYPSSLSAEPIIERLNSLCRGLNAELEIINHSLPINLSDDCEIVGILSSAYREIIGKAPSLYSTGGGTYARKCGSQSVAFGPVFENDNSRIHNSDEGLDEESFFKHAEICLEAMYRLYTGKK